MRYLSLTPGVSLVTIAPGVYRAEVWRGETVEWSKTGALADVVEAARTWMRYARPQA